MLYSAIENIKRIINDSIAPEVVIDNVVEVLSGGANNNAAGIIISPINVEELRMLRDQQYVVKREAGLYPKNPAVNLQLSLLFSAHVSGYENDLRNLQEVISFFQRRTFLDGSQFPLFAAAHIERLTIDMVTLSMERLQQMWSMPGGKYYPSVLYKAGMVVIDSIEEQPVRPILELHTEYKPKAPKEIHAMEKSIHQYDKLFSILFSHLGFPASSAAYDTRIAIDQVMQIKPDRMTKGLFDQHDIRYRFHHDILTCFIRMAPDGKKAFYKLPKDRLVRFLLTASSGFLASITADTLSGRNQSHHVEIRLKTTKVSDTLRRQSLAAVQDQELERICYRGNDEQAGYWQSRPRLLTNIFGVIDITPSGIRGNRLYQNETQQIRYYTGSNRESHKHPYEIVLHPN